MRTVHLDLVRAVDMFVVRNGIVVAEDTDGKRVHWIVLREDGNYYRFKDDRRRTARAFLASCCVVPTVAVIDEFLREVDAFDPRSSRRVTWFNRDRSAKWETREE